MFSLGDVLIKIDVRESSGTMLTRHHVMLVVGESKDKNPIVAHMQTYPEWGLVQEELKRGKDLKLIRYNWPEKTQRAIASAVQLSLSSKKFIINQEIILAHNNAVAPYRPDCVLDAEGKLMMLRQEFKRNTGTLNVFNPNPREKTVMSCHEWVMSILHYACEQTELPVPAVFQIPPYLAWADRLNYSAEQDESVICNLVTLKSFSLYNNQSKSPVSTEKATESTMNNVFSFFRSVASIFYSPSHDVERSNNGNQMN